jgi:hypothetical protein
MRPTALLCALALAACAAQDVRPEPVIEVRVGIGEGWATGYDPLLRDGLRILRPTGWRWVLVARGAQAEVFVDHADLSSVGPDGRLVCGDVGRHVLGASRVRVDPACASGAVPTVVAHELLHWAGCRHLDDPRALLAPRLYWHDPPCDPGAEVCPGRLPVTEMTSADLAEFRRATR